MPDALLNSVPAGIAPRSPQDIRNGRSTQRRNAAIRITDLSCCHLPSIPVLACSFNMCPRVIHNLRALSLLSSHVQIVSGPRYPVSQTYFLSDLLVCILCCSSLSGPISASLGLSYYLLPTVLCFCLCLCFCFVSVFVLALFPFSLLDSLYR